MTKMQIKGNRFLVWLANLLTKHANRLLKKGEVKTISNYSANLIDPFIIVVKFTVNGDKYHVIHQGYYIDKYKEHGTDDLPLKDDEFEQLIKSHRGKWFLRK